MLLVHVKGDTVKETSCERNFAFGVLINHFWQLFHGSIIFFKFISFFCGLLKFIEELYRF